MKRAHLVNFLAIKTQEHLAIRASLTMKESYFSTLKTLEKYSPRFPIQDIKLLRAYYFQIKIVARDAAHNYLYDDIFESDSFGYFNIKLKNAKFHPQVHIIEIYETSKHPGLELLLGSYIPLVIDSHKKIVICDFDKTLVDTKYSTPEEVYRSLTSPIEKFPTVQKSVDIITRYIQEGFHPFILSASPHFYEEAMRDWLYANNIYSAGIFLKDYRKIFSIIEGDLTPKDLKVQGIYKLGHLLDIVYMTGIPEEVVLMGDNFESDPIIYLTFYELINGTLEPREVWNRLKQIDAFKLSNKQNSLLLNKIYQIKDLVRRNKNQSKIKIFIRKKASETTVNIPEEFNLGKQFVELY